METKNPLVWVWEVGLGMRVRVSVGVGMGNAGDFKEDNERMGCITFGRLR